MITQFRMQFISNAVQCLSFMNDIKQIIFKLNPGSFPKFDDNFSYVTMIEIFHWNKKHRP